MIPSAYLVSWTEPDGSTRSARHTQRAAARGSMIMLRSRGCTNVTFAPLWE